MVLIYGICEECAHHRPVVKRTVVEVLTFTQASASPYMVDQRREKQLCIDCAQQHDAHQRRALQYIAENGGGA